MRGEVTNLLFNFFEGSNEEIMGRKQKEEVLCWNLGNAVRGQGRCKNPVRLSMYDGPVETVEYMWMNIPCMLDWIIGFGQKTAEIHFLGMNKQLISAQNEMLLGLN